MKTYKLTTTYPGSFSIGHLATLDKSGKYYSLGTTTRDVNYIENNHTYWQEVCPKCLENIKTCSAFGCKKKDYEILSFMTKYNALYTKREDGFFRTGALGASWTENSFKNNSMYNIHSVKRLSDGEVFTIGDNTKYGCIDTFYIKNDYLLATIVLESMGRYLKDLEKIKQPLLITEDGKKFYDSSSTVYYVSIINLNIKPILIYIIKNNIEDNLKSYALDNKYFASINAAKKYAEENKPKVKLFTTEDGVDIFKGNSYTIVTNDFFEIRTLVAMGNEINNIKRFSTKKAAENYIKMNKSCLSLNDVLTSCSVLGLGITKDRLKKELTKIVKQKLK